MGENPELIAMARRIAAEFYAADERIAFQLFAPGVLGGKHDEDEAVQCALAAIIETQERDAALAEDRYLETDWQEPGQHIAAAIRSGQHYGKDHPHA